jgi:predicted Zn-dependent peptidase
VRTMLVRMLVAALLAGACGAAPHANTTLSLPVSRFQLANRMTVVLLPDENATMATMIVRYGVGSVDDPMHEEGVAHLAAHLMNAQRFGQTSLATQLERIAIELRVEPRLRWTGFGARFAPENLEAALKIEAARLESPCAHIDDATFAAERANVAEELTTHVSWRLNRLVGQGIYPSSDPMFRAYAADAASVLAISREQACAFIDRRFAPGNATLVVTGPITEAALTRAVAALGDVPAQRFDPATKMPMHPASATMSSMAADLPAPVVAVAWPIPSDAGEHERAFILLRQVASTLRAGLYRDARSFVLWLPLRGDTADAKLAQVSKAIDGSVDAFSTRVRYAGQEAELRPRMRACSTSRRS